MADSSSPFSGRIVAGRYRLGPKLGSGQDVASFEAWDERSQTVVVLKIVHPELGDAPQVRRQFRSTMAAAAGIRHPNVAPILDVGSDQWGGREVLYFVTERFAGGTLRDLLDRGRTLTPSQALVVGLDACKALDAVHRAGLVHGDVRPATLVFGDDRRLRLLDVGLTHALQDGLGDLSTRGNDRVRYCSPEQALGARGDERSDVYSLCLTLIEAVSGSVPFEGDSAVATMTNRVDRLMPVSADLGALAAVLERAGRPQAADRYSAAEFGRALVQAAEKLPRPTPVPVLSASPFAQESVPPAGRQRPATIVIDTSNPIPAPTRADLDSLASAAPAPIEVEQFDDLEMPAPRGSRRWLVAMLVLVGLLGGALAWYVARPQNVPVPDLVGLEVGVARNEVGGNFEIVEQLEPSEDVDAGLVVRTEPTEGESLEEGATLVLYVSSGPAPRVLPDLVGLTLDEATEALENLGLVLEEGEPASDEEIEEGLVASWEVPESPTLDAGDTVTKGTVVRVVLSSGPALRTIPDLTGRSLEEATTELEDLGLEVEQGDDVFHPTAPVGSVASAEPAFGQTAERGDTIVLHLSKGPEMVLIPNVAGLDYNGIITALQTTGFSIGKVQGTTTKKFIGFNVNAALAIPGMQFPKGTVVDVFFEW